MRLIILAAGQGFKLDGFNKLLIRDPMSKKTIIEKYMELFPQYKITVVVGYEAVNIMSSYPDLDYIYNDKWRITGNSYSLSLVLDEEPCVILSSDLIFDKEITELIEKGPENSVLVFQSENKGINTVRCKTEGDTIKSLYMGEGYNNDPETIGIYKISDKKILREWKKRCNQNKNVFAGLNLPLDIAEIKAIDKKNLFLHEINTPQDYLNLIKKNRG